MAKSQSASNTEVWCSQQEIDVADVGWSWQ